MRRDSVRQARGRAQRTRGLAQRTRGRAQASVQPINRSAWLHCNSSLGTPPLSHFIHHPPPTTITTPSSIVHHRVCESSRDPRLIVRVLDNQGHVCLSLLHHLVKTSV
ncbi:hypothetical protein Hdeb2414_s0014g00432581 [Helianthus debilis subsp. tardiflorus]